MSKKTNYYFNQIKAIIDRYPFQEDELANIKANFHQIERRLNDKQLYVGVVGEFSSGKSTFINALLEDELLSTDILQATTCTTTYLYYGVSIDVELRLHNQKTYSLSNPEVFKALNLSHHVDQNQSPDWKKLISTLTTDNKIASRLKSVNISHPAKRLKQGLVIVDTPGSNSNISEHTSIAARTLREECDTAIILIPADVPVSQTLIEFLNTNLKGMIHRCIFLVTKIDKIRRKTQQQQLLSFIQERLSTALDVPEVNLLAVAPKVIIDHLNNEASYLKPEQLNHFLYQFQAVTDTIWVTLEEEKEKVILDKINLLLSETLQKLDQYLQGIEKIYLEQSQALEANKIPDLKIYIDKSKANHLHSLEEKIKEIRQNFQSSLNNSKNEYIFKIVERIKQQQQEEKIKHYLEFKLKFELRKMFDDLVEERDEYINQQIQATQNQTQKFETNFQEIYDNLATVGGKLSRSDLKKDKSQLNKDFQPLSKIDFDTPDINKDNQMGVGIAVGFILAAVLPGIGVILGSLLGGAFGSLFGPSLDEIQNQVIAQIKPKLKQELDQINHNLLDSFDQVSKDLIASLNQNIDYHFSYYKELAQDMEEKHRQSDLENEKNKKSIQEDLNRIIKYQTEIKETH
mgnify:CR=1 FL=1